MILSTYCEVWVVADQIVHQSSVTDAGESWLHLVIPEVACLPERLRMFRDSGRHCFGACGWRFCVLKGHSFKISAALDSKMAKSLVLFRLFGWMRWL